MEFIDLERAKSLYREHEDVFLRYAELLQKYNARFNITAITDDRSIRYKHFYDSLAGAQYIKEKALVCEVGSGGGFPSIPLKIVRNDLKFTLIESTAKKCEFLKIVINELQLEGVRVLNVRAEDAAKDSLYREKFDACCARAVARLNTLSEYCLPLVKKGGWFLAYKGNAEEEIKEAENAIRLLGGGRTEYAEYFLGEDYGSHSIVRILKEKNTPSAYPRGCGKERSKPL